MRTVRACCSYSLGSGGGIGGVQIEIDHILEASSAQKTSHTSAHSRGAVLDLLADERVSQVKPTSTPTPTPRPRPTAFFLFQFVILSFLRVCGGGGDGLGLVRRPAQPKQSARYVFGCQTVILWHAGRGRRASEFPASPISSQAKSSPTALCVVSLSGGGLVELGLGEGALGMVSSRNSPPPHPPFRVAFAKTTRFQNAVTC